MLCWVIDRRCDTSAGSVSKRSGLLQIEELQAEESQLRTDAGQGDSQQPAVHDLLAKLALSSPEETEQALSELLTATASARYSTQNCCNRHDTQSCRCA